jgi:hypothetical protein
VSEAEITSGVRRAIRSFLDDDLLPRLQELPGVHDEALYVHTLERIWGAPKLSTKQNYYQFVFERSP